MNCPRCESNKCGTVDSRESTGNTRRRRYLCKGCGHRFSTREQLHQENVHTVNVPDVLSAMEHSLTMCAVHLRNLQQEFTRKP